MDLRSKMKFDLRVIGPFRIQKPFALRQINQVAVLVFGDIGMFKTGKILQLFGVFAGDPAGLIKWHRIELHRCAIFMQQPVLDHLELQFPYTADDLLIAAILGEQLGYPFIGNCNKPFLQLLGFHRVFIDHLFKNFRRKGRNAGKIELFPFGQGIADLEVAGIEKPYDISRDRLLRSHLYLWPEKYRDC
jgi:hypothetical protein